MFERYTEKARRIIFFARYEASQVGSSYIETEHLLLGLLREDKALTNRFLRQYSLVDSIRKQIEAHTTVREKVSTSVDLPLSNECKRVLAYASEEAERLNHKHIGTEHMLLGILREEKSLAAKVLNEAGLDLASTRQELAQTPHDGGVSRPSGTVPRFEAATVTEHYVRKHGELSEDVNESLARIMFIVHRLEFANANGENVKARFYENEERKERENLRLLLKQQPPA